MRSRRYRWSVRSTGHPAAYHPISRPRRAPLQAAGWLRANGNKTVLIEGHCDERGTLAYNLVLGEKRARSAKKYLLDMGVQVSQLQITSYGETRPFCKQANEDCYQQNRRAHFVTK